MIAMVNRIGMLRGVSTLTLMSMLLAACGDNAATAVPQAGQTAGAAIATTGSGASTAVAGAGDAAATAAAAAGTNVAGGAGTVVAGAGTAVSGAGTTVAGGGMALPADCTNVQITYWSSFSGPDGAFMTNLVNQFNTANPNIKVTQNIIPGAQYSTKLGTAQAADQLPDVVQV